MTITKIIIHFDSSSVEIITRWQCKMKAVMSPACRCSLGGWIMMKYAEGRVVPTDHQWNAHQLMETIVLLIHLPQLIWKRTLSACFLLERQQFYWLSGALIICLMALFPLGSLRQRAWLHTNTKEEHQRMWTCLLHTPWETQFFVL